MPKKGGGISFIINIQGESKEDMQKENIDEPIEKKSISINKNISKKKKVTTRKQIRKY